jgi:triphosphoribosyl-dephospho-CoA synthetase
MAEIAARSSPTVVDHTSDDTSLTSDAPEIATIQTSPAEFISALKRLAQGEPVEAILPGDKFHDYGRFITHFVEATPLPELMTPQERSDYDARRALIRNELLVELKRDLNDILRASPPPSASKEAHANAIVAKQLATELTVALRKDLEPLSRRGDKDVWSTLIEGLRDRSQENHLVSRGHTSESIILALTELETACREMNSNKEHIGVKAIEGGLQHSPNGGERISKLGSAFFKAVRNDVLHAREEGRPTLPDDLVRNCVDYLITRASPVGALAGINSPLSILRDGGGLSVEEAEKRQLSFLNEPLYQRVSERFVETQWDSLDFEGPHGFLICSDPVARYDLEIKLAVEFLREDATKALQAAGITLKKGEDPLAVLKTKTAERIFGDSPTRAEGWQEIIWILLKHEKAYFSADPKATEEAARAESLDEPITKEIRDMGVRSEGHFILSLCCLLSRTIDRAQALPGKNPAEALTNLESDVVSALQEGAPRPTIQFFKYALTIERLFKDIADRTSPTWKETWNKKVSLEQHARNTIFTSDKTKALLNEMGVSQSDAPKIVGLVSSLFDTLRNRWAHNTRECPTKAEVAELLHTAALLSTLTDLTDGRLPQYTSTRTHFEVRDVALAASLHSSVFECISSTIAGTTSTQEAAASLKRLVSECAKESPSGDPLSSDDKFRQGAVRELSEGITAIWESKILPPEETTEGLMSRAALVSALLRWTKEPSLHEPTFPLWQVYGTAAPSPGSV